jgi:hypothetical protein
MSQAKILILDIETAPETAYIWKRFKETIGQSQIVAPSYLMCLGWKWLGDKCAKTLILPDTQKGKLRLSNRRWFPSGNDAGLASMAHSLLSEADIVVGHNLRQFDVAVLNHRFIVHGLTPPPPYKIVDTIETLKRRVRMPSNSLECATNLFGLADPKRKQTFELWSGCLNGDPESWKTMATYCGGDVDKTEWLYLKLLPWMEQHPNMGLYTDCNGGKLVCPKCGGTEFRNNGKRHCTSVGLYHRMQCVACGGWARGRHMDKDYDRSHVLQHSVVS